MNFPDTFKHSDDICFIRKNYSLRNELEMLCYPEDFGAHPFYDIYSSDINKFDLAYYAIKYLKGKI
jgi:hypothetical protein